MADDAEEVHPKQKPDWTMSQEREFIETLVGQRFNFFLIFFSLVINGSVNARTQLNLQIILTIGMLVCWMIAYTLVVANMKLNLILGKLDPDHPFRVIDDQVHVTGRNWIGSRIPVFCSSILTLGAVLSWCSCISV